MLGPFLLVNPDGWARFGPAVEGKVNPDERDEDDTGEFYYSLVIIMIMITRAIKRLTRVVTVMMRWVKPGVEVLKRNLTPRVVLAELDLLCSWVACA